jgi:putative transcriptional regulator
MDRPATSLAPALLVSMPQLTDPNFHRTVILLCKHSTEGALGLVVNRPMVTSGRVIVSLDPPASLDRELKVWIGGPVEPTRCWMLVGESADSDPQDDPTVCMTIAEGLSLSTSPELLRRLLEPNPPPCSRLIVGYAGWGPGQLEEELEASAWLLSDVDPSLVFHPQPDRMWETAIRRLGADPGFLHASRGVH